MLTKARRRLETKWKLWLREEAQISPRSAARLLAVAEVFEKIPHEVLERFTLTALYNLAEPGVPQSLREYCVEQATNGERSRRRTIIDQKGNR